MDLFSYSIEISLHVFPLHQILIKVLVIYVIVWVVRLPPISVMIVAKGLQENDNESHQWLDQAELQSGLFAEAQKSNGICFACGGEEHR